MFQDRVDAGRKLADALQEYAGERAVVLALPRGGVVLGYEIARTLKLPFDIVVTRKIGHPNNPEYAIGAVDENGTTIMNEAETATLDKAWVREETERQMQEAARRSRLYRGEKDPLNLTDMTVIIVDDGIATGLTMRLAVAAVKAQTPRNIVVAVPVAPSESLGMLQKEGADRVIVLEPPQEFMGAIGAHYVEFEQVKDAEVEKLLQLTR